MTTVHKFPFKALDAIEVPGAPLHVNFDPKGELVAWVLMDDSPTHRVVVRGTGHDLPDGEWRYLNTFMSEPFVFHAFAEVVA